MKLLLVLLFYCSPADLLVIDVVVSLAMSAFTLLLLLLVTFVQYLVISNFS